MPDPLTKQCYNEYSFYVIIQAWVVRKQKYSFHLQGSFQTLYTAIFTYIEDILNALPML